MLRFVLLAVLAVVLYRFVGRSGRDLLSRAGFGADPRRPAGPTSVERTENLVPCAGCGVRFPESRAAFCPGRPARDRYCSEDCCLAAQVPS